MAETCNYCGGPLVEKNRDRYYLVKGCRRGCPCYKTFDIKTMKPIQESGSAVHHAIMKQKYLPENILQEHTDFAVTVGG